jgi:hypothetical protein
MCVINHDNTSDWFAQHYGVPQGAVLSPTLFSVFINKAARMLSVNPATNDGATQLTLYADDQSFCADTNRPDYIRRFRIGLLILHNWSMRYCQQFHPRKSQIVWYTRQQHFAPPVSFSLGSILLTVAPTYRYLGLYLDANFSWRTHCKQLMVRAQYDAYCIRRVIDFEVDASMHFSSVWLLCLTYLLPRWTYGAPFIRAIDSWTHRLQSLLAGVIRKVLALPISTHMLSVLVDANLLPLRTFNQYHILRTANKMAALPATHNISKIFTHNYNTSIQRRPHTITAGKGPYIHRQATPARARMAMQPH